MIVALYIAGAIVAMALLLKATDRFFRRPVSEAPAPDERPPLLAHPHAAGDECCGQHAVCERDSQPDSIEYFEDEELDIFCGRQSREYSDEEADMFREVMLTLRPEEIGPWTRSLRMRGIEMPCDVRDELLMIVSETAAAPLSPTLS